MRFYNSTLAGLSIYDVKVLLIRVSEEVKFEVRNNGEEVHNQML